MTNIADVHRHQPIEQLVVTNTSHSVSDGNSHQIQSESPQEQPTSSIENTINSVLGGVLSYTTLQPLKTAKYDDEQSNTIHAWKRTTGACDDAEVARIMGQIKQGFTTQSNQVHVNQITLDIDAHVLRLPNWREHDLQINVKLPNNQYVSITIPKMVFDAREQAVTVHASHGNRVVSTSTVLPCLQEVTYQDEVETSRSIEVPESCAFVAESGEVRYRCERCESWGKTVTFQKQHALKRHIATKHLALDVLQTCEQCNRKFLCKRELAAHVQRAHTNPRRFGCHYCPQKFIQRNHLDRHLKNIHSATMQPTSAYADQKPNNIQYVIVDQPMHAFDNDTSPSHSSHDYTPQYATTQHDQTLSLELKAEALPEDFDVVEDDDDYGAEDLPADFVPSRSKYHKLNHVCHACKQRFSRPKRLKQHLFRIHNIGEADPMDNRRFPCPACGLTFSRASNARRHLREGLCKAENIKQNQADNEIESL